MGTHVIADNLASPLDSDRPWYAYLPVYVVLCLIQFVSAAGLTALYVVLPKLYALYPTQPALIGWSITSYLLVSAAASAVCGRFGDLFGRRQVACWMLVIAGAGSAISAWATSLEVLVIGAVLQGVASALTPIAVGMTREYLPARLVPVGIGVIGAAASGGAGLVFIGGGIIVDSYSAFGGFIFKLVLSIIALAAILTMIVPSAIERRSLAQIDMVRGILFVPAIVAIMIALEEGAHWGWQDSKTIACLTGGALVLIYWYWHQARQPHPLIAVKLLFQGRLLTANIIYLLLGLGCVQAGLVTSLLLRHPAWTGIGFGLSAAAAGLLFSPANFITFLTGPAAGAMTQRFGIRTSTVISALLALASWVGLAVAHASLALVVAFAVLDIAAYAMLFTVIMNVAVTLVPRDATSEASGVMHTLFLMAMAVGSQIIFALLRVDMVTDHPGGLMMASPAGFMLIFGYIALTCLGMALLALFLPSRAASQNTALGIDEAQPALSR